MRRLLATLAIALPAAAAGPKLSALLEEGAQAYIVEFRPGADPRALARNARLALVEHPDLQPRHLLISAPLKEVAELAGLQEVAYVFPASAELLKGERVTACAGALIAEGLLAEYSSVGSGWPHGTGGVQLGYHLGATTDRLPPSVVQAVILRALQAWARHAPLRFVPVVDPSANSTLSIRFVRGSHGDSYPFDGRGRILAHTFYPSPPNREPIAGDMHLDADEDWTVDGAGTDLFTVVLHELGHALGLGHSDRPGSVMYPYYRLAAELSDDDIAGIQAIYGADAEPGPSPADPPVSLAIRITSPANGATTSASSLPLRGTLSGMTGAAQVRWECDRGPAGGAVASPDWSVESVPLAEGVNRFTATAIDASGATASATVVVTRTPERPDAGPSGPPPALRITFPALSIVSASGPTILLRGTSSNANRVTWTASTGASGDASGTGNWTAVIPLLAGTNTITVRAAAASGATAWRSLTVVRR